MSTQYVQYGDTIVTLAVRHLNDGERWVDLVIANNLDQPYVVDDASAFKLQGLRVLGVSDQIIIPDSGTNASKQLTQNQVENLAYGIDVSWSQHSLDIIRDGQFIGLDQGIDNLPLIAWRRIMTPIGGLPAHPEYGCNVHTHVGAEASEWRALLAVQDVKTALLEDERFQSVTGTAEWFDGGLFIVANITPIPPAQTFKLPVMITAGGANA